MFKLLNKKKNNKGFTLVELVIVVAILAILVGILAPQYTKYVEKSRKSADVSNLENLVTAFKTAAADGTTVIPKGSYCIAIGKSGAVVIKDSAVSNTNDTTGITVDKTATDVIKGFAGDTWTSTKLKSSKWTANQNDTTGDNLKSICATCVMNSDGSLDVSYSPTWIKSMADQSDAKADGE